MGRGLLKLLKLLTPDVKGQCDDAFVTVMNLTSKDDEYSLRHIKQKLFASNLWCHMVAKYFLMSVKCSKSSKKVLCNNIDPIYLWTAANFLHMVVNTVRKYSVSSYLYLYAYRHYFLYTSYVQGWVAEWRTLREFFCIDSFVLILKETASRHNITRL